MKKWRDMTPHERLLDQCDIVKDKYIPLEGIYAIGLKQCGKRKKIEKSLRVKNRL